MTCSDSNIKYLKKIANTIDKMNGLIDKAIRDLEKPNYVLDDSIVSHTLNDVSTITQWGVFRINMFNINSVVTLECLRSFTNRTGADKYVKTLDAGNYVVFEIETKI